MSACESQAITRPVEDEDFLLAMEMNALIALPLVLKATIELGILEIMTECRPTAQLSPAQIASCLSAKNPQAPETLDRILRLLVSYSILSCTLAQDTEGNPLRLYGLGPKSKHFVRAHGTATFAAPLLLMLTDKIVTAGWFLLLPFFLMYSIVHLHHHMLYNHSFGYAVHSFQVLLKRTYYGKEETPSNLPINGLHVFEYTNKDKR
ncbi:hypothetical protein NL676_039715 [Syzygium grande]|nr:hypothetical protein NL676_039715 [Syzygium grande]